MSLSSSSSLASSCASPRQQTADEILQEYLRQQKQQRQPQVCAAPAKQVAPKQNTSKKTQFSSNSTLSPSRLGSFTNSWQRQQRRTRPPTWLPAPGEHEDAAEAALQASPIALVQRKLVAFFYVYAALVGCLYLSYAAFCYYKAADSGKSAAAAGQARAANMVSGEHEPLVASAEPSRRDELESKLHLLERYIEVIALDLEQTKLRLKEREKCSCSINCSFNGTLFHDKQTWQQKCDICSCQSGKISCAPRKCAQQNCDDAILLPGQCCPTCMKQCKFNKTLVRHNHTIKLKDSSKLCKCYDGQIKCEPLAAAQPNDLQKRPTFGAQTANRTSFAAPEANK